MIIYLELLDTQEEKDLFESLYNHYKEYMYHIAYRILQNNHDAEDAVHQSFLSIIKHLDKLLDIKCRKTQSYLAIVVENKSLDIIRQREHYSTSNYDDNFVGITVEPICDSPLANAITKLPARYRNVILLKYDNGFSTKEISQMFNMQPEATQRLIHRAKARLKIILEEEE